MKKTIIFLLSAILAVSCIKDRAPQAPEEDAEVTLRVFPEQASTKADAYTDQTASECQINSVVYVVCTGDGLVECILDGSSQTTTVTLSTGQKSIWALVNIDLDDYPTFGTESELEAMEISFSEHSADNFPMSGKVSRNIGVGTNTVNIPVQRYLARIYVAKITNALEGNLAGESMTVRNTYVTNVVGGCTFAGLQPEGIAWYNKFGRADGATAPAQMITSASSSLVGEFTVREDSRAVPSGSSYQPGTMLYFFPNDAAADVNGWSSMFTKRYTRIVVEVLIRGELYYYPVNIIGSRRNQAYTLYLTVTRAGSKDPDSFIWAQIVDLTYSINVFDEFEDDLEITY